MTIPKREAVDGLGFDAEFCLLAELAGLELLAEIPVVTPTDLGAPETVVCRAIEVLSKLCYQNYLALGYPYFVYHSWYKMERWKCISMYAIPVHREGIY